MGYYNKLQIYWFSFEQRRNFHGLMSENLIDEKVNIEIDKIDKFVPDRWISKDNKQKIWRENIKQIFNNEITYFFKIKDNIIARKDEMISKDLEKLRNQNKKINNQFTKAIYKGIKEDVKNIIEIDDETSKITKYLPFEAAHWIRTNKINDIVNFTNTSKKIVEEHIANIKLCTSTFFDAQDANDEIGFWKGNFFGTKDEKQQYLNNKIIIEREKINFTQLNHAFRDKIIEKNQLSNLIDENNMTTEYASKKFVDAAINTALIERNYIQPIKDELIFECNNDPEKDFIRNKECNRNFLAEKQLINDTDTNEISAIVDKEYNSESQNQNVDEVVQENANFHIQESDDEFAASWDFRN